jgi:poly-gamma-glutamate synthesis protein (capsule biosynthesis protein)
MDGLLSTVENVEAWGFDFAGANRTPEEQAAPVMVDVNGISIGLLCWTEMTNGMEKANRAAREYGVNYLRGANFGADVDKLREAGAEVVFALPHWGAEYTQQPIQSVEATARKLVAAGVDVVIGSHPHMVQPVTWVEAQAESGETRRGLVAYSMGNFISNMSKRYTDCGILLDFTLKERASGGFDVTDVKVMPTFCWRQPDVIQTLPALDYYDAPPEGMTDAIWQRLREGVDTLRKLIPDFPMIGVTAQPTASQ